MTMYYVDTASTAGGDGTTQELTGDHRAFATIAAVNAASFSAGDQILFKRGCTFRGNLGDPGAAVTFGAYGTGAKPILSGGVLVTTSGDWTQEAGGASITDVQPSAQAEDGYFNTATGTTFNSSYNDARIGSEDSAVGYFGRYVLNVPKDANCSDFTLTLLATANSSSTGTLRIRAALGDDVVAPTTAAEGRALSLTTAYVDWEVEAWTSATSYETPDLSAIVEEVVAQASWVSGDHITFVIVPQTSFGAWTYKQFEAFGDAFHHGPYLNGTYDEESSLWYLSSITADPQVLVHDGAPGRFRALKTGLASQWDYWWDNPNDRFYIYSTANPTTLATVLEIGSDQFTVGPVTTSGVTFENLDIRIARETNVLMWGATGITFTACDFSLSGGAGVQFNNGGAGTVSGCTFTDWNRGDNNGGFGVHVIEYSGTESGPVSVTDSTFAMNAPNLGLQPDAIMIDEGGAFTAITGNTFTNAGAAEYMIGVCIYHPASTQTTGEISGNTFVDMGRMAISLTGLEANGATPTITVVRNSITNADTGDIVDTEAIRCRDFTTASTVTVAYNLIVGTADGTNAHHGIQVKGADGVRIWNNTIIGADNGIEVNDLDADHSTDLDVRNNLVANNRGYGLNLAASNTITTWGYNCWYNNTSGTLNGKAAGTGDVTDNPLFVNAAGGDFRLTAASPCRDAGVDVGLTTDYDERAVPNGSAPEIGAHEYYGGGGPGTGVLIHPWCAWYKKKGRMTQV